MVCFSLEISRLRLQMVGRYFFSRSIAVWMKRMLCRTLGFSGMMKNASSLDLAGFSSTASLDPA